MHALGHLAQERLGNGLVGGVVLEIDGNEKLLSLFVDIADIYTTLVGEENPISLKRKVSGTTGQDDWVERAVAVRYPKSRNTKRTNGAAQGDY